MKVDNCERGHSSSAMPSGYATAAKEVILLVN